MKQSSFITYRGVSESVRGTKSSDKCPYLIARVCFNFSRFFQPGSARHSCLRRRRTVASFFCGGFWPFFAFINWGLRRKVAAASVRQLQNTAVVNVLVSWRDYPSPRLFDERRLLFSSFAFARDSFCATTCKRSSRIVIDMVNIRTCPSNFPPPGLFAERRRLLFVRF